MSCHILYTYNTSAIRVHSGFSNIVKDPMLIVLKVLKKYTTCTNVYHFFPDVIMQCDFSKDICGLRVEGGRNFRIHFSNGNNELIIL